MEPGRDLSLPTLANFRDLGGYRTADGRTTTPGLVFRSRALDVIDDGDLDTLTGLGIATVVDFRTGAERSAAPDRLGSLMYALELDVLRDSPDDAPAQLAAIETDPKAAVDLLGGGRGVSLFEQGYREFITLSSAHEAYGRFFRAILEEPTTPLLFHCTNGKDRTGWAAAAVLLLCGVAQRDVEDDFLLTNRDLLPSLAPVFERFTVVGGDPALLRIALGVDVAYIRASIDEMTSTFGSIAGYFDAALGIDRATQAEIVAALLRG